MKKTLMILTAILFAWSSQAFVIEYNYNGKETDMGANQQSTFNFKGLMVYDTVTSNITYVTWKTDKTYHVSTITNFTYTTVISPGNTPNTVITSSFSETDSNGLYHLNNYMLSGQNITLHIAARTNVKFPKIMSGTNDRDLAPDDNGNEVLATWNENMTFSEAKTDADNDANLTSDEVANATILGLRQKGYTAD